MTVRPVFAPPHAHAPVTAAVGLAGAALTLLVVWFSPVRKVREAPLVPMIDLPGDTLPMTE